MTKTDLQTAINDIKEINSDYAGKEECSQLLMDRLKELEMDLLDQFYGFMNKANIKKKPRAKRSKNKVISDKPLINNQIP